MGLAAYRKKRDFKRTPEPADKKKAGKGKQLTFVIQRHNATRLHYDFRLEMEGVLKSWAIPKGPSMNPNDKRLAMMVEDHPYDYGSFKGEIPEGNYGAGLVEIWDKGTYEYIGIPDNISAEKKILADLQKGSLKFIIKGKKLKGEFALVKLRGETFPENAWLLIKHNDKYAVNTIYDSEEFTPKRSAITKQLKEKKKKSNDKKKS